MEPDMAPVPCFVGASCATLPACWLKHRLHGAQAAFLAVLDDTTIAELAQPEAGLRSLPGVAA
jgi:Rrf2 family nitric oxide-sensitive transcriptional repressor